MQPSQTRNDNLSRGSAGTPEFQQRWGNFALGPEDVARFRHALEQDTGGPAPESDAEIMQMAYDTILALAVLSETARANGRVLAEPPAPGSLG